MESTNIPRRSLLKGIVRGAPLAAGVAAGVAMRSAAVAKEVADPAIAALRQRVDALQERLENSDKKTQKLVRVALIAASLSLGIDATALL